jgi:hypothetical protein
VNETKWLDADGVPFDPRSTIESWAAGDNQEAPAELWQRLYHQGTVGTASYAATPMLVRLIAALAAPDWNAYALMASIEESRSGATSIALPDELQHAYRQAWQDVVPLASDHLRLASDDLLVRSLIAVLAHAKQQHTLAAIALCTEDERQEMLGIDD